MTKNKLKKSRGDLKDATDIASPSPSIISVPQEEKKQSKSTDLTLQARTLVSTPRICRNKYWPYDLSYYGPGVQMSLEILEKLAHTNFNSPHPYPVNPTVLFDFIKIRKLVEEATTLAVRAATGITSSALSASSRRLIDPDVMALESPRLLANNKLSKEQKHRLLKDATQKLSHAYQLDDVAATAIVLGCASPLEDVAKLVLQKEAQNPDAQYVHFFHEKIPGISFKENTNINCLNDVVGSMPTEAAVYRSRAELKMIKGDYLGAVADLKEGLGLCKLYSQHTKEGSEAMEEKGEPVRARNPANLSGDARYGAKTNEKDQLNSLELQLLFYRGIAYLQMACDQVKNALGDVLLVSSASDTHETQKNFVAEHATVSKEETQDQIDARKLVRTYAKRALKDYMAFLAHLEYTPGLPIEFLKPLQENVSISIGPNNGLSRGERLLRSGIKSQTAESQVLAAYEKKRKEANESDMPEFPTPVVHRLDTLFAAVPPAGLPPYPSDDETTKARTKLQYLIPEFSEGVTYHPHLTEVLHTVLLCHCLIQTSTKEVLRHAHMTARIVRMADGVGIFSLPSLPAARADWTGVVQSTRNWIGLEQEWDVLCAPATRSLPKEKAARIAAEEKRSRDGAMRDGFGEGMAVDVGRWVLEAPALGGEGGKGRRKKKGRKGQRERCGEMEGLERGSRGVECGRLSR